MASLQAGALVAAPLLGGADLLACDDAFWRHQPGRSPAGAGPKDDFFPASIQRAVASLNLGEHQQSSHGLPTRSQAIPPSK